MRMPTDLFESARLKLTIYYFIVLAVFCIVLTVGVRRLTDYELERSGLAERGTIQDLFRNYYNDTDTPPNSMYPRYFENSQQRQADETRRDLDRDFVLFDVLLLAAGAVVSYWYAGRTLRPIEEAHEQQRRFTSDASHELRTPLASMRLENEVFLRQKNFSEKDAREQLASNLEEVERLEKLANNLLALSKYEYANMSHEPVNVVEVVHDALARARGNRQAKSVTFSEEVQPAKLDINRDSVVELLGILLDNAVKYGGTPGKVEVAGKLASDVYILTVRDHGTGIAEQDLPHIFERMYRGDKARSSKIAGHGIGLSLARQIAEANGAELIVGNASKGSGAVFTLTFS